MSSSISFPRRLPSQPDLVLLAGRFWVLKCSVTRALGSSFRYYVI
ncbi:hypothetical protein SLEP1_g3740 [Rubroshorea leprosula]|uniref:Uncharacterized protein n=1 Tax=Rubroshorea leprosula TaxID=152421 RepID=A0AAV5HV63_9ROSI|nr:hypothetical protein SLEP1_g3740 [Rubroshorea leprosula]